jgi:neopullulanase
MTDPATTRSWTPAWVRDAVFYQIFPDRFATSPRVAKPGPLEPWDSPPTVRGFKGGDLLGIAEHLDHIQALGANAIYLNPIFASASNHRYHTYDYRKVDPILGGDDALRELIDACHGRGMKIVLDGVFNHASRGFWPFHHVLEVGKASPYRDWFFFNDEDLEADRPLRPYPSHEVVVDVGSMTEEQMSGRESMRRFGYQAWWGLPALPKLNTANPDVRAYLLDVAEYWLRFGADGWRLDVPEEIPDDFWHAFRARVKAVDPDAYIVAEIWHEKPQDLRGDMYDALMNYPLGSAIASFVGAGRLDRRVLDQHFAITNAVRDDDGPAFADRLSRALTAYAHDVTQVQLNLIDSHDTPRFLSMVHGDKSALRLATLIQMTVPGAPTIYYGNEIGMTGEMDPANRGAFPWDQPETWDRDLLAYISGATALRHQHPVLRHGSFETITAQGQAIAYRRRLGADEAVIVVNCGSEPNLLYLNVGDLGGRSLLPQRWPGSPAGHVSDTIPIIDGWAAIEMAPRDGTVLFAA